MAKLLTLLLCLVLFASQAIAAPRIIWLTSGKGKDTFARGFAKMEDKLASEKKRTRGLLWDVLHVYVDEQKVTFDNENFKVIVKMRARARKEYNSNTTCQALVTKARTVLFGSSALASLLEYFPGIKEEDLRYFVYLQGTVETYMDKGGKDSEELDPKETPDPKKAIVSATTNCRLSAISEKAFFD
jgi:hypothetical protein